jgi:hypothetical protein
MPKNLLRIKDWSLIYENNRTRSLKNMLWVPVPNKLDGDGYTELVDHQNGVAHLGAWLTILQIASKCTPRGTLVGDSGEAHTPHSLARMSRIPASVYEEAIPRLMNIQWLEMQGESASAHDGAEIPHHSGTTLRASDYEGKGMEGMEAKEGNEQNGDHVGDDPPTRLDQFLASYPKKVKRDAAARAYVSVIDTEVKHGELMAGLQRWVASDQWQRSIEADGGRFVPDPDKFIFDRRYLDMPAAKSDGWTEAERIARGEKHG